MVGENKIEINEWGSFKAQIIGSECHFYVKNMHIPKVVFPFYENFKGRVGFKPRLRGGEVWLDNIRVKNIDEFSYSEKGKFNNIIYNKDSLLTDWKVSGPYKSRVAEIENPGENVTNKDQQNYKWEKFESDQRGCVIAGRITRYSTEEKYAYFLTEITSEENVMADMQFSTLNKLHVWVNSEYAGMIENQPYAWYDFFLNPEHKGNSLAINLQEGANKILVLVEGGNYGGDGFYAYIKKNS